MAIPIEIQRQANYELARRDFFHYCHLSDSSFFRYDREYQQYMAREMQQFLSTDEDILVVNVPPRFGKSYMATRFTEWMLGNDPTNKIMTGSYNERLSTNFAKQVRNTIQEQKADDDIVVFNDMFPDVKIKQGDGSMNLWALEGQYNNYLATSPTGTATGFGARIIIIDDLIKNAEEAYNADTLEKHWDWFRNTMLSRLEQGGKIIVIMTRWSEQDLAGRILDTFPALGFKLRHIKLQAQKPDGTMLCDDILNERDYELRKRTLGASIASANYQQEPLDEVGRLYSNGFKTYDRLPDNVLTIESYTDTADTGKDYLASLIYARTLDDKVFILDMIYTQEDMAVTEPLLARKIYEHKVKHSIIEANNGGRGYSRSVERIVKQEYGSNYTTFESFHQTKNKMARILSNATWVMENIYMPDGWEYKYEDAYKALTTFSRKGKNKHDDMPDAITGVAERVSVGIGKQDTSTEETIEALRSLGLGRSRRR